MFTSTSSCPPNLPLPLSYQPVKLLCLLFVSHIRSTLQIFALGPEWVLALHPVCLHAQCCNTAYQRANTHTNISSTQEKCIKSQMRLPSERTSTQTGIHATKRLLLRYTEFFGKSLKTKTAQSKEKNRKNPTRNSSRSLSILSGDIKSKTLSKTRVHTMC